MSIMQYQGLLSIKATATNNFNFQLFLERNCPSDSIAYEA